MRKFADPMTVIPGATRRMKEGEVAPVLDKKGRQVWDMPQPIGYVKRMQIVKEVQTVNGVKKIVKVKKPVQFPVYQGVSARLANEIRAHYKRQARKQKARETSNSILETLRNLTNDAQEVQT